MKLKKYFRNVLCGLAILLSISGFAGTVNAATIPLDVTATNKSGIASKDPYSRKEAKSDSVQSFYITLTSLTNGPSMSFTSYNDVGEQVSKSYAIKITNMDLNERASAKYSVTALAGAKYYVCATAPQYYVDVHAVGRYCP